MRIRTLLLLAVLTAPAPLAAQASLALDSLFRAHRQPLTFGTAAMAGPGWEFLLAEAAAAQFVMVGESHNLREIPLFTARLFEALHDRAGYEYLALENGPYAMRQLSADGVRGDAAAVETLARRYPNALQFRTDQELTMIVTAGRLSGAGSRALWGLDQVWGAQHVLERLRTLAPAPVRGRIDGLLAEATRLEARRPAQGVDRFIDDVLTDGDLGALERGFANGPAEALELLSDLRTSHEIYTSRTDGPAIYRSNRRREQYMRSNFVRNYRAALAAGDTLPRVVLKFGQWHALKGVLNWGEVEPLGTFVGEMARANGLQSLHIWTGLVNEPGHVWTLCDFPDYVPLADAGTTDRWWVVDLRPIRPYVAAGLVEINDELRRIVFGFDVALLIGSGNRATFERLN